MGTKGRVEAVERWAQALDGGQDDQDGDDWLYRLFLSLHWSEIGAFCDFLLALERGHGLDDQLVDAADRAWLKLWDHAAGDDTTLEKMVALFGERGHVWTVAGAS